MLYDFCNAFPTVLHEWLFLVLETLQAPVLIRNIIKSMYTCISAFSSGVGDGSFLFNVLGGVRNRMPSKFDPVSALCQSLHSPLFNVV